MAEFRVLGPLAVEGDGTGSPWLRTQMVRRLLAALLCRANNVVPAVVLVAALWGEDAPPSARKGLQIYVRRLRTALDAEQRIVHELGGYRICVAEDELDAARFARLITEANMATPERAAELLAQALELWRGAAFEDVRDHTPTADEARRLDEERVRVQAWHSQLQLELGRHAESIPRLTELTEAHPYREDLRGHLMLALYRCGRQTEALEVFRSTRRLLDEELGVEPGPALQQLHEAILRADASLDLPPRPAVTVPRELPADITGFVGRAEQLQALDEMLPDSSPVVISAIAGSGGVGKTTLAVHWAHQVADRFPDGQLYVNLRGFDPADAPVSAADATRRLLDSLGVAPQRIPAGMEAQTALYRSLLAGKRMLVVLDNARDAEQVRSLLPGSPTCLVVLTSRNRLASLVATSSARSLMLDVLTDAEARRLLETRLGAGRVAAEPQAVEEIVARCVRLPLALAIVAARATTHPELSLTALAAELAGARNRLDAFGSDDDPLTDLRAVFSWSYRQLSVGAARLFRLLGLHPGPDISEPAAASLAGLPLDQAKLLLRELTRAHLITEHTPTRYTFHDLLRAYAGEQAHSHDAETDRGAAIHRVLDHYIHTAQAADRLLDRAREPITLVPPVLGVAPESVVDYEQAMIWFNAEHQVLVAAVRHAAANGLDTQTWQLARTLITFLDRQGHWESQAAVHHLALDAARRLADREMQAFAHNGLALAYTRLGRYEDAYTHRFHALDLHRQVGNCTGQAQTHMGTGWLLQLQGRCTEGLDHARQALDLYQAAAHRVGQANALNVVGWCHAQLGEYQQALAYCEQALTRLQELGDNSGEADTWDSIGSAHHHLGQHDRAITSYQNAIQLYRDLGHRSYEAETLTRLGDTHQTAGNHDGARIAWQQALAIYTKLDHTEAGQVRAKLEQLNPTLAAR